MPQGIDENYNGAPDAVEGGESPDPTALKMLLMKLMEMLGMSGPEPEPAPAPPGFDGAPMGEGDDQSALETDMRGGKSFDEAHGTDVEGSGSFQPPANKGKLDAFRAKLKGAAPK